MESKDRKIGRPKLGLPRRIRITTTIEPAKLKLLREHANKVKKSLGQLADEYVNEKIGQASDDADGA